MKITDRFHRHGIPIDWPTIAAAWERLIPSGCLISEKEIISYAAEQLADAPEEHRKWITQLAIAEPDEREAISRALCHLCGAGIDIGIRKWRLLLLKELLPALGWDPLHTLLELADFWASFDYPEDSPLMVQGRGNLITPQDYYTEANLRSTLDRHHLWVQQEEQKLCGTSESNVLDSC